MKKINQYQYKDLMNRIKNIENEKINQARKNCTKARVEVTATQRFELVKNGKVKLKKDISAISTYDDVSKVFDFSKYETGGGLDEDKYKPILAKINKLANSARDHLMLNNAENVIQCLNRLEELSL